MKTSLLKSIFLTFCLTILFFGSPVIAKHREDFGVWGAIQGQGSFSSDPKLSQWQWWMEGQARWSNDVSRLGQSIIRPGLGYKTSAQTSVWLGYAWVKSSPLGKEQTDEHRIWQQLSWNKKYDWGGLITRTRLEQRFLSSGHDVGWRFRQLLKYTHPLFSQQVYLSLWDEVFININSTDWGARGGFGQNRAFAGLGFFLDTQKHYRFEFGYINQFIGQGKQVNHLISGSFMIRY